MVCQVCGKNAATVHFTEIHDNKMSEIHVCEHCAEEKGMHTPAQQHKFEIADLLAGMVDSMTHTEEERVGHVQPLDDAPERDERLLVVRGAVVRQVDEHLRRARVRRGAHREGDRALLVALGDLVGRDDLPLVALVARLPTSLLAARGTTRPVSAPWRSAPTAAPPCRRSSSAPPTSAAVTTSMLSNAPASSTPCSPPDTVPR